MKAYLILADGSILEGEGFGKKGISVGEVVFNTGMTGYQEVLTDPSYFGQIVTMTYPLIGNYGINSIDMESEKSFVKGFVVREFCDKPSNFRCENTLNEFLESQNIIGISNIDTRHLTKEIRERGVMNGAIIHGVEFSKDDILDEINSYVISDAVKNTTIDGIQHYKSEKGNYKVCLFDFGYKKNILNSLLKRGCDVDVVNAFENPKNVLEKDYDGIMLSNGPGDPSENVEIIENLKVLFNGDKPIFGICLGHQLMALSQGAKTEKLKYGHRGANHPVKDILKDRTYITSQNHGYAVVGDTVDKNIGDVSHINVNDGTVEGVRYKNKNIFTVQFHPEASPGPMDTGYLFDEFIDLMKGGNKNAEK